MAFLFKSKKNADKTHSSKDGISGIPGSQGGANGRMMQNENGVGQTTPGSSINNSLNSLPGGATPSPEQIGGRRGHSSDLAQDSPVGFPFSICNA
jgi:hypothetical protein